MGKDAKYVVRLDAEEREQLQTLVDKGRGSKSEKISLHASIASDISFMSLILRCVSFALSIFCVISSLLHFPTLL